MRNAFSINCQKIPKKFVNESPFLYVDLSSIHTVQFNFSVERWDLHFVTVIWDTSNINFCSLLLKETTASQLHFSRVGKIHPKILVSLLSVSSSFVCVCIMICVISSRKEVVNY